MENSGVLHRPIHESVSPLFYGMLREQYSLGDTSRLMDSPFNVLFCIENTETEQYVCRDSLSLCISALKQTTSLLPEEAGLILLLPQFSSEDCYNKFMEDFKESYMNSEVNRNLQVMRLDYAKSILNMETMH